MVQLKQSINLLLDRTLGITIKKSSDLGKWIANQPTGMIEEFTYRYVKGWVSAKSADFPLKATLCINNFPVISTWITKKSTHNSFHELREFRLSIRGIWDFCTEKDTITITINGRTLPINAKGMYKRVTNSGSKNLDDLKKLLDENYIFSNVGDLQLFKKIDTVWQQKIFDLYDNVSDVLSSEWNISPFLIYGSLLGQVREGGFIGHDSDFDIAYVSKQKKGSCAARELSEIAISLKDAGFLVDQRKTAIHIHSKLEPELKIDLFHLFFDKTDELKFTFGIAGTSRFTREDWKGLKSGQFAGHKVTVPVSAEKLVEYMYGSSWMVPVAGFDWSHVRTSREESGDVSQKIQKEINKNR